MIVPTQLRKKMRRLMSLLRIRKLMLQVFLLNQRGEDLLPLAGHQLQEEELLQPEGLLEVPPQALELGVVHQQVAQADLHLDLEL
jgi:hypothetical protein